MLASFFQSLASNKETEKQRFRKLLSHVGERVHVIAIRSEVSSPNRLYVQDRLTRQQQQQNENPEQPSELIVAASENRQQQQQRRTTRSGRSNSNGSFSNNNNDNNNNNGEFMMQRVQSELREEDEREFDFIDESEIEMGGEDEQNVSNTNNHHHPDNEQLNHDDDDDDEEDDLDPQVRIRKFELRGYLAFVDAKNILIFDSCPPDSKEFKKRLDALLPEHKQFLQSFPLCTTVKIESIVSITEDSKMNEEKKESDDDQNLSSQKTKKWKKNDKKRNNNVNKNNHHVVNNNNKKTELEEMELRNANFARLMASTMSGDILCQSLLLRFVWERICLEDQKDKVLLGKKARNIIATTGNSPNLRATASNGGSAEISEGTSSALHAIRLRRHQLIQQLMENRRQQQQASVSVSTASGAAAATAIDNTTSNNNNSSDNPVPTSPSNNPIGSESNNSLPAALLHQLPNSSNNEQQKEDEKNEKVADEEDRNSDDNPSFHEDGHEHPSRKASASTGRSPTNLSLPVVQPGNRNANDDDDDDDDEDDDDHHQSNQNNHSLHPALSIREQFGFNLESDDDDDEIDDIYDDLANNAALQSIPANTHLADCEIMSSRNGDTANAQSAVSRFISRTVSNGAESDEPEYTTIINRRFPHLQHFIGEQLIRMKLADEESEVPATFQLLEHAGRKFGCDFGFEMCIAQAKHLRKLNEMIETGQATSSGSTFASLFGLGSNGSRVNFFDMDEGQPLRDFLRGRLGPNGGRATGSGDGDSILFRRHLFDDLINTNFYFGPQRTLYRVRFAFWCVMLLVFIACTTILYVKSVQQFIFSQWVVHRSLVDLAVLLMLPATSALIICIGLIGNISAIATKKSFVLPHFERYKLLRFLVNLAVVITFVTIGLKFKSATDAESVDGAIATIALRDNSTMCYFQLLHNCSGGSHPCDRNAFIYGNDTQNCPSNCDYAGTIFKGITDVSLWWSPTQGCNSFVKQEIFTELIFSSVTCVALFAMNLVWGCTESTCFDQFNRR